MPIDVTNVLDYVVASGIDPTAVLLIVAFFCLVRNNKATKNTVSILRAIARVVDARARRRK
ncbi:hypothetical protein [Cryobacterium sp. Y11]|jgi:hypothetical protein|uniref:hypothetical protein n=1 Tax=Cryobacterium sp. Y11 TaxID=2045016 RepID=UPI000CE4F2D9|nr:hypothetical protein [Cryobacterium sp. Y11]